MKKKPGQEQTQTSDLVVKTKVLGPSRIPNRPFGRLVRKEGMRKPFPSLFLKTNSPVLNKDSSDPMILVNRLNCKWRTDSRTMKNDQYIFINDTVVL